MGTVIIIPARLESTRLRNKPLEPLDGVPLVVCTARQASKCRNVERVVVATDAPKIQRAVQHAGYEAALTSREHVSGTDRVAEVAEKLDATRIVNLQGDEPFIDPRDLESLIHALKKPGAEIATLRRALEDPSEIDNPNVVKVVTDKRGEALYFSRAPIPFARQARKGTEGYYGHVGVYGYERTALLRFRDAPVGVLERQEGLEQLRALEMGMSIKVVDALGVTRGIDTPEDLTWARARVDKLGQSAFP